MPVSKHSVKSCCRSKSYIFEIDKAINKSHLDLFKAAGYVAPPNFAAAGVFYVRGHGLVATTSFGSRKINVKCSGNECPQVLSSFEQILISIFDKKK